MVRCLPALLLLCLILWSPVVGANVEPEALLPAESIAYVRCDGLAEHREAWGRTVLGGIFERELDPLVRELSEVVRAALGEYLLDRRLPGNASADQVLKLQAAVAELPRLREHLAEHGFAATLEAAVGEKPIVQITVVFPNANRPETRSAVFGGVRLLAFLLWDAEMQASEERGRPMLWGHLKGAATLACWPEGDHMLLTLGNAGPDRAIAVAEGERESLNGNPLLERVRDFDAYQTCLQGFIDLGTIAGFADADPTTAAVLHALGLDDLGAATFHVGYEGPYQRSTVIIDLPAERRGLLKGLTAGDEIDLANLPPLPPDLTGLTAVSFDVRAHFDALVLSDLTPDEDETGDSPTPREELEAFERAAGVDLREDLLDRLGSPLVVYTSPAQGPLFFGSVLAVPARDPAAVVETLDRIFRTEAALDATDLSIAPHDVHGETLHVLRFGSGGDAIIPFPYGTYATQGDWLLLGTFPQPVQATIDRAAGRLTSWDVPDEVVRIVREARGREDSRLVGLRIVDPRPPAETLLSLLPLLGGGLGTFNDPDLVLDVSLAPNTHAITEALSHNVTAVYDDGHALRCESYDTLPLPPGAEWLGESAPLVAFPLFSVYLFFAAG